MAWIPVFGQYKAEIAGFTYDVQTDAYTCTAGKALSFRKYDVGADGGWRKIYWADCSDCQQCPVEAHVRARGQAQATHPHTL